MLFWGRYLFVSISAFYTSALCTLAGQGTATQSQPLISEPKIVLHDSVPQETDISLSVTYYRPDVFNKYQKSAALDMSNHIPVPPKNNSIVNSVNELVFRLNIENLSQKDLRVFLKCGEPDVIEIIDLDDPLKKVFSGGFRGNFNRVSKFSPNFYMPLIIKRGETKNFLAHVKINGRYRYKMPVQLFSESGYHIFYLKEIDRTRIQLIYHGFILGGIFIIGMFMFAQFFQNRDHAYLRYALYAITLFFFLIRFMERNANIGMVSYFFPDFTVHAHVPLALLTTIFYAWFIKSLLVITRQEPVLYYFIRLITIGLAVACVLHLLSYFFIANPVFRLFTYNLGILGSAITILILAILLLIFKKKDTVVNLVLAGIGAFTVSIVAFIYINRSGQSVNFKLLPPVSVFELGCFIEILFLGLALGYKTHLQKREKENAEAQKRNVEIAALRAQMNPHFLFNSLNSIENFIMKNEKRLASDYLNKFARLIRMILDSSRNELVPFSKDMEAIELYIEMERLRFNNSFEYKVETDRELADGDYIVPPLLIQPFVENAIIHGLGNSTKRGLLLTVAASIKDDMIKYTIKDNGVGRRRAIEYKKLNRNSHKSVGVEISKERLQRHNQENHSQGGINFLDLYDDKNNAAGTKVIITLKAL